MLSIEDCIALSELTEAEIDAIAEHEHIPEIVAAEMGRYLLTQADGEMRISRMIADDIERARTHGDVVKIAQLKMVLKHFIETHHHTGMRR